MKKTVGRQGVALASHRDDRRNRHLKTEQFKYGSQPKKSTQVKTKKKKNYKRKDKGQDNLAYDEASTDSDSSIEELQQREILITIVTGSRGKYLHVDWSSYSDSSIEELQDREILITIVTGSRGVLGDFGFELMGGNNDPDLAEYNDTGIYIQDVTPGSDVEKTLDGGDQILKIGGHCVLDVPLHHALNLIRAADSRVVVNILKHPDNPMSPTIPDDSDDDSGPELDEDELNDEISSILSRNSQGVNTAASTMMVDETNDGEEVDVIFMSGRPGHLDDLDFEFAGGKDAPYVPKNGGIFITSVKFGSILEEIISTGDKIIRLEGIDITNVPRFTVINLIRASHGQARMTVRKANKQQVNFSAFDDVEVRVNVLGAKDEIIVEIKTGPKGRRGQLGFKVTGGRDKPCKPGDPGVFIKEVKPGSKLEKILKPGDKLLKVAGKNVTNSTQGQVLDVIKAADRRVLLHIKRSSTDPVDKVKKTISELFEPSQLEEFLAAFEVYCDDRDRKMDISRLPRLCRALGFNLTEQDFEHMTTRHENGIGRIAFQEFVHMIGEFSSIRQKDRDILEAFEIFDRECHGFFLLEDLKAAFRCMPGYSTLTDEEMDHITKTADSNGDGKVYYQDFKELVLPIFHKY